MKEKLYIKALVDQGSQDWPYKYLSQAIEMGRDACYHEVKQSELVGRGGAAFSTATKWGFVQDKDHVTLICNADEGEPGTFKDRYIMENNPALLLEGMLISAFIVNAENVYIYVRGEYVEAIAKMRAAIKQAGGILKSYQKATGVDLHVQVAVGQGAYVCGDETSLINSVEGVRPNSRIKPPYPTEEGLYGYPTIVNNVETLMNLPVIIRDGGTGYKALGVEGSRGTKLVSLSGRVRNPGVYEVEFGKATLKEIIQELGGGIVGDVPLKFVIPGGISTRLFLADEIDIPYDYPHIKEAGSSLGSGAIIVADQTICAVEMARNAADFFSKETCGICFPCKEGNRQIHAMLERICEGKGKTEYLNLIEEISVTTSRAARCGLGQSAGNLLVSAIEKIPEDFIRYFDRIEQEGKK